MMACKMVDSLEEETSKNKPGMQVADYFQKIFSVPRYHNEMAIQIIGPLIAGHT